MQALCMAYGHAGRLGACSFQGKWDAPEGKHSLCLLLTKHKMGIVSKKKKGRDKVNSVILITRPTYWSKVQYKSFQARRLPESEEAIVPMQILAGELTHSKHCVLCESRQHLKKPPLLPCRLETLILL